MHRTLTLALLLAGLAPPAWGQAPPTLLGTIAAIDAATGSLRLTHYSMMKPRELSLARADLPVTDALGKPLKLTDLGPRQRVVVQLGPDGDVIAIRREDPCRWGLVVAVEPAERRLRVQEGYTERQLQVPPEAVVLVDGQKADLAQVEANKAFKAILAPDQRTLLQLECGKGVSSSNPFCKQLSERGILMKIDHDRHTFQILTQEGRFVLQDWEFRPWSAVLWMHSSYRLRSTDIQTLQPYCKVNFQYESDTRQVNRVIAEVPILARRRVTGVQTAERWLTLDTAEQAQKFPVAADVTVRTPEGPGKWDDVAVDVLVSAGLSLDGKEVLYLYLWDK